MLIAKQNFANRAESLPYLRQWLTRTLQTAIAEASIAAKGFFCSRKIVARTYPNSPAPRFRNVVTNEPLSNQRTTRQCDDAPAIVPGRTTARR